MSDKTRILFATTGILIRRLEGAGAMAHVDDGGYAPSDGELNTICYTYGERLLMLTWQNMKGASMA